MDSFGSTSNINTSLSCQYTTELLNIKISVRWADRTLTLKSLAVEVAVKSRFWFLSPALFLSIKPNLIWCNQLEQILEHKQVDAVSPVAKKTSFTKDPSEQFADLRTWFREAPALSLPAM